MIAPPLRFITCGSVDDGKSTLIGRLLYESRHIHDDHLRALDYGVMFPDALPIKIIRRGTLTCSAATGDCNFTLAPAEDLRAAN